MKFCDTSALTGVTQTTDGYILADVRAARTGIQQYAGWEVGKPDVEVVNVYRPSDSVFSRESLETFPNIPLTLGHPETPVNAETYDTENVGNVFEVAKDGESIRASIAVMSKRAIDAIKGGKRQLSVGYDAELVWADGVAPDGQTYQAVQTNIRANHLAIVDEARAGPEYRIGDNANKWGIAPISPTEKKETPKMADTLTTVVLGDKAVKIDAADAYALEVFKADTTKTLSDMKAEHQSEIDKLAEEVGKLKADNKALEDAKMTPEAMTKAVADRVALEGAVKLLAKDMKTEGLSDADIRKSAVASKMGADTIKDASDAEILGMFKALSKDAKPSDPVRTIIKGGLNDTAANDAWGPVLDSVGLAKKEA